ncbi:MAG: hypothetical protein JXQ76_02115, partial [Campylobacterales bacterium]|nr:hypothetical protein [Campylobacterales bacterium]
MKRLAFVCTGIDDGLQHLLKSKEKVVTLLKNSGWDAIPLRLHTVDTLTEYLIEYRESDIEESIFYFIGHGILAESSKQLTLKLSRSGRLGLNQIYDFFFDYINPKKLAIIIDACHSGTFVGVSQENRNIEYLTSSKK